MTKPMKAAALLALTLFMSAAMSACGCEHSHWSEADCTQPARCLDCGKAEGIPKGHQWMDADCTNAQTCSVCGETKGEPRGHSWKDATKSLPQTCRRCGVTQGDALREELSFDDAYDAVCDEISQQLDGAEFVYDADYRILYVSITAGEGTAEAIIMKPDSVSEYWSGISTKICSVSEAAREHFLEAGFGVDCCIMLISDVNADNALLSAKNGKITFDVMA